MKIWTNEEVDKAITRAIKTYKKNQFKKELKNYINTIIDGKEDRYLINMFMDFLRILREENNDNTGTESETD